VVTARSVESRVLRIELNLTYPVPLYQRLGRLDLLRFLQGLFLGHFILPHLICPQGHRRGYTQCGLQSPSAFRSPAPLNHPTCESATASPQPAPSSQNDPQRPAAPPRAATARNALHLYWIMVIPGKFFARAYLPSTEKQQVAAHTPLLQVRLARMVHELRAATAPPGVHVHRAAEPC
jgi:hypothetical protein